MFVSCHIACPAKGGRTRMQIFTKTLVLVKHARFIYSTFINFEVRNVIQNSFLYKNTSFYFFRTVKAKTFQSVNKWNAEHRTKKQEKGTFETSETLKTIFLYNLIICSYYETY